MQNFFWLRHVLPTCCAAPFQESISILYSSHTILPMYVCIAYKNQGRRETKSGDSVHPDQERRTQLLVCRATSIREGVPDNVSVCIMKSSTSVSTVSDEALGSTSAVALLTLKRMGPRRPARSVPGSRMAPAGSAQERSEADHRCLSPQGRRSAQSRRRAEASAAVGGRGGIAKRVRHA